MTREFTRIEFEGGDVIVVKETEHDEYIVHGNRSSYCETLSHTHALSHLELVNELIGKVGKKVERQLSHYSLK